MIFVQGFRSVDCAEHQPRHEERGRSDQPLDKNEYVGNQTQLSVDTLEPGFGVGGFVQFDNHQAGNESSTSVST